MFTESGGLMNGTEYVEDEIFIGSINSDKLIIFLREMESKLEKKNLLSNYWSIKIGAFIILILIRNFI